MCMYVRYWCHRCSLLVPPKPGDSEVQNLFRTLAKRVNLAQHVAGAARVPLYGPTDIEVHRGTDGRLYVLDCHRVLPPEVPIMYHCGQLVHLLRPGALARALSGHAVG